MATFNANQQSPRFKSLGELADFLADITLQLPELSVWEYCDVVVVCYTKTMDEFLYFSESDVELVTPKDLFIQIASVL